MRMHLVEMWERVLSHGLVTGSLTDRLTLVCAPVNKRDSQGERREWAPQAKGVVSKRTHNDADQGPGQEV